MIITVVLALLVAGGALGGAIYLRNRQKSAESAPPPPLPPVTATACRIEPCLVVATTTVGTTKIELLADAGGKSARLRIGPEWLIEATVTERGVTLTRDSLQCVADTWTACLIKGQQANGGVVGEVVIGRADKWNLLERSYLSDAGHLSLAEVVADNSRPELVAVQKGFFAQVFLLDGSEAGCTKTYAKLDQLPGWPTVKPAKTQLKPCG